MWWQSRFEVAVAVIGEDAAMKEAIRWKVTVSKETDESLRSFLRARGLKHGDLSRFVERAAATTVFHETLADIHYRNRDIDPAVLEAEIEEAIREVRAEKRGLSYQAAAAIGA